jgi:hypothetical protein
LALPHSLLVRVLAALPLDCRLRCTEVCRTWRAAVSDRSLWLRVDLSATSGVTHEVTAALLHAAAMCAAGRMQTLVLPLLVTKPLMLVTLLEVLQANSASIRELDTTSPLLQHALYLPHIQVLRVLGAAPQLQVFRTDVAACVRGAVRMLRSEAPFGSLRARIVHVVNESYAEVGTEEEDTHVDDADVIELAGAIRQHASLESVWLENVPLHTPAVLDAFVDAALTRRTSELDFERCSLSPASVPALARLLGSTALMRLAVVNGGRQLLDAPAAVQLADALRANATLRLLMLTAVDMWSEPRAGAVATTALAAHSSLEAINLSNNRVYVDGAAAVGAALATLVAGNASVLRRLFVSCCTLGDAGLAPLVDALPRNTHLCVLHCADNAMSHSFARDRFLPAIRANTSLRELVATQWWGGGGSCESDEVPEAEALVMARLPSQHHHSH